MEILHKSKRSKSLVGTTDIRRPGNKPENGNPVQAGSTHADPINRSGFLTTQFRGKTLAFLDEINGVTKPVPLHIVEDLEASFEYWVALRGLKKRIQYPEGIDHYSKVQFLYSQLRTIVPKQYGINIEYTSNGD